MPHAHEASLFLFWDIDGTLLSTGRAGVFAWEDAAEAVLGQKVDFSALDTAGLTDIEIGAMILRAHGARADADSVARIVGLYERGLPASLPRRRGRVMPNVRMILKAVQERPDIECRLLTGNTRAGAAAKLGHYGLDGFFDLDAGAFADGAVDRPAIARRALEMLRAGGVQIEPDRVFVIGDTPHDIRCAAAIGARTVAVATGGYARAELKAHDPWLVLDRLPDPDAFLTLLCTPC